MEIQEQVQAYTAWVNSQLKKRGKNIVNLGEDLKDGVALVAVVEIVSGHTLGGIKPTCENEKRENVLKVLQFMRNAGIKLHHVSVDEITSGNVKTIMQLILALAAHFKPASIGGRKVESPRQRNEVSLRIKQRWRDSRVKESIGKPGMESSMQADVEKELAAIRDITQCLQKVLLEEIPGQPLEGHDADEQSVIIQARLDQAIVDKVNLEEENHIARQENRKLTSEKSALEQRFLQQEEELLSIRQQLLQSNLSRDKLQSEKAELIAELTETRRNQDELRTKCRDHERTLERMENEAIQNKINHSREIRKLDKEIHLARQESYNGQINDSVFHDKPFIGSPNGKSPGSPFLNRSKGSPLLGRSPTPNTPGSPILSRRSPLSRNHPSRRRKTMENHVTRVLYFTDRDMTPCMTSISKRVGDITLGEFKTVIKKEGNYRFIFKALDPELGTVKEEVFHDDDVIPGWEGKIVAWVEEVLRV
uniref:dixin isoform X2 n=1 Tax=Ciona intestinalis TaxID=7719 RepID=UPI0000524A76|nr:dixin isoform X2 [Ciona intestinalis]|eukprot:XP_004227212.1 dixin isoform X2 [Ciona intestinalis]